MNKRVNQNIANERKELKIWQGIIILHIILLFTHSYYYCSSKQNKLEIGNKDIIERINKVKSRFVEKIKTENLRNLCTPTKGEEKT